MHNYYTVSAMSAPDPTVTRPISGRISEKDFEFLMSHHIDGKVTASEKLRYVAGFFRRYHESFARYEHALAESQRLLEPTRLKLKAFEHEQGLHSQLLDSTFQALPELFATLISARTELDNASDGAAKSAAMKLEANVLQNLLQLLESILRLALTSKSPCYHPKLLKGRLDTITELVELIQRGPAVSTP
jgi:hypothetical protein